MPSRVFFSACFPLHEILPSNRGCFSLLLGFLGFWDSRGRRLTLRCGPHAFALAHPCHFMRLSNSTPKRRQVCGHAHPQFHPFFALSSFSQPIIFPALFTASFALFLGNLPSLPFRFSLAACTRSATNHGRSRRQSGPHHRRSAMVAAGRRPELPMGFQVGFFFPANIVTPQAPLRCGASSGPPRTSSRLPYLRATRSTWSRGFLGDCTALSLRGIFLLRGAFSPRDVLPLRGAYSLRGTDHSR